jgi:hypothetical protein
LRRKPLPFTDLTRRLKAVGYDLVTGPDGLPVFTKTIPAYFPYAGPRTLLYPAPYDDDEVIPKDVVDNIIIHLYLTSDEEISFWANDPPVH